MLAIRLARTGKKHQAYFRIVVADSKKTPTAKFVEIIGNYDPHAKTINIKKDRADYYLSNGAQPSNTVAILFKKDGIKLPDWVKIVEKKKAPKKEVVEEQPKVEESTKEEPKEEIAETPAESSEEAPVEAAETKEAE